MPVQREKVEQAHIVQLLRSIGGQVYTLGTRRRAGDYQGTMQTPGVPDLIAFLPVVRGYRPEQDEPVFYGPTLVFIECKAAGGRLRPEQATFRDLCAERRLPHIVGDLDAVIAWLTDHGYVNANQFPHYRQPKARVV